MSPTVLFVAHVLSFAAVPVALATRRGTLTTPLLYAYMAVTLFLGGFLGSVYVFPVVGDVAVSGGAVSYGAFMFTALILLFTTRDVLVIRDAVALVLMTTAFKVVFVLLATRSLQADAVINPFGVPPGVFDSSLRVVLLGSLLTIAELITLVAVFERIKARRVGPIRPVVYPAVLTAVLAIDGAFFPLLDGPSTTSLAEAVRLSVAGKLLLAAAFSIPVVAYLILFRDRVALYEAEPLSVSELLRVPNLDLIKEIERQQRALEHQATHDGLTGLLNRSEMLRRVDEALGRRGGRPGRCVAVMFIDLDDFKLVNDGHGHGAGDAVLIAVAERIRACLRENDVAARLGGDEFTALITDVADTATATAVGRRILHRLAEPLPINQETIVTIHASLGIAFADEHSTATAEILTRNADLAMYHAKDLGKDRLEVFTDDLHHRAQARAELLTEIGLGVRAGEFVAHYQPQVELASGRVVGVEALVRWYHPWRGMLTPADFIAQAENSSAIIEMGEQVLTQACTDAVDWTRAGSRPLGLSVNVSTRQLRDPILVQQVTDALHRSGLEPDLLTLEITESSLMSDVHGSVRTVEVLKELGVKISIDDFGTGFSSLAYLHQLPVDMLKIDKSFVDRICDREVASGGPLVQSIIGLGNLLDLTVIAEGVESSEQCCALVELGCELGQGFHFSPALSSSQISTLLLEESDLLAGDPGPALTP